MAGLSLLSTRKMVLQAEGEDTIAERSATIELSLPPRSLYLLEADARFTLAHSIPKELGCERRLSIMFRDDLPPPWAR